MSTMLCAKPMTVTRGANPMLVACGQCTNCRLNDRRKWTARILLEGLDAERNLREVSWVTLTYDDTTIPYQGRGRTSRPSLRPSDTQLLLKRMRRELGSFRFFLVGEYGDETQRPHYHALLFGLPVLQVERYLQADWENRYGHTRTRPWRMREDHGGDQEAADITVARAKYCASYTVKKMTKADDGRLDERCPEFSRMSRRPGLGCVGTLVDLHTTDAGSRHIIDSGDVNYTVRINGQIWPLARSVRAWLRDQLDIPQAQEDRMKLWPNATHGIRGQTLEEYQRAAETGAKITYLEQRKRRTL